MVMEPSDHLRCRGQVVEADHGRIGCGEAESMGRTRATRASLRVAQVEGWQGQRKQPTGCKA